MTGTSSSCSQETSFSDEQAKYDAIETMQHRIRQDSSGIILRHFHGVTSRVRTHRTVGP